MLAQGCFILRCDETFHGLSSGDVLTTTIGKPYTGRDEGQPSCGELGDLPEGATLTWTARPDGPGDGCDDHADVEVTALSTGTVSGNVLTLPNGCTGRWVLTAEALSDDADFLSNPEPENPRWYIQRNFTRTAGDCFGNASAPADCTDNFVATSTR